MRACAIGHDGCLYRAVTGGDQPVKNRLGKPGEFGPVQPVEADTVRPCGGNHLGCVRICSVRINQPPDQTEGSSGAQGAEVVAGTGQYALQSRQARGPRVDPIRLCSQQETEPGIVGDPRRPLRNECSQFRIDRSSASVASLLKRDNPRDQRDGSHHSDPSQQTLKPTVCSPVSFGIGITTNRTGRQELGLERAQITAMQRRPFLGRLQAPAAIQIAFGAAAPIPTSCGLGQVAKHPKTVTILVDPGPEARPIPDQSLMGHLDRRLPGCTVSIERQEPSAAECVEHPASRPGRTGRTQLRPTHPSASVFGALAQRNQPPEHASGLDLLDLLQPKVDLLGPAGEGTGHSAEPVVGITGHHMVDALVVQLGEGILQKRQRAGLVGDISRDPSYQAGLKRGANGASGFGDGPLQLVGGQRVDRHRGRANQPSEVGMTQRLIVEVGTKRRDDVEPSLFLGQGLDQRLEEPVGTA